MYQDFKHPGEARAEQSFSLLHFFLFDDVHCDKERNVAYLKKNHKRTFVSNLSINYLKFSLPFTPAGRHTQPNQAF